jgi:hypothetical protein
MSIEEGNKLIAEFMGYTVGILNGWMSGSNEYSYMKEGTEIKNPIKLKQLQYHTSWDWQIPVVPKLFHTIRKYIASTKKKDYVQFTTWTNQYAGAVMNNDCEMGWQIITKALEWYNKEQNDKPSVATNLNQGTES